MSKTKKILHEMLQSAVEVKDFPRVGVDFIDIAPVLEDSNFLRTFGKFVRETAIAEDLFDSVAIVGIESRGFILGSAASAIVDFPFVMLRKPGKLPGKVVSAKYEKEYGYDELCVQDGILSKYTTLIVIDDVVATGGTLLAAAELAKMSGVERVFNIALFDLQSIPRKQQIQIESIIAK